jgi:hypothetical protein
MVRRVVVYVVDNWWKKKGIIGDGREGLVTVGCGLVHLLFMCMTVGLPIPGRNGSGWVGFGELVKGRVDAEERVVWR